MTYPGSAAAQAGIAPVGLAAKVRSVLVRLPKWIAILAGVTALVFILYVAGLAYAFLSNFNDAVELLSATYGVNQWLAKAGALAFLGPLAWGLRASIGRATNRRTGARIFAMSYASLYFLAMFFVSRNWAFSHDTGEVLRWYAETPRGVVFYDSPGFDRYGKRLKPVTPEFMEQYERRQLGQLPKEVPLQQLADLGLFDPLTGEPLYWYCRRPDGRYAVFDAPGFDPASRAILEEVTPQAADLLRAAALAERSREDEERLREERRREDEQAADRATAVARARDEEAARAAGERMAFVDRHIDRAALGSGGAGYAVSLDSPGGRLDVEIVDSAVKRALRNRGIRVLPLFRPAFRTDGVHRALFDGSPSTAQQLDLARYCDGVVMGSVRLRGDPQNTGGLYVAEVVAVLHDVSCAGNVRSEIEVRGKGGGLNPSAATADALERLAAELEGEVSSWL